jgi:hypothetical protein
MYDGILNKYYYYLFSLALQSSAGYGLLGSAAQRGLWPPRHMRLRDHTQ